MKREINGILCRYSHSLLKFMLNFFISCLESVEILLVNEFIEWSTNISWSVQGLFSIDFFFFLLLVSFCVQ